MERVKNVAKQVAMLLMSVVLVLTTVLVVPEAGVEVKASNISIPSSAKEYKGHYYKVYEAKNEIEWGQAKKYCEAKGGHLATFTSVGEEVFLENLSGENECWVGANRDNWETINKWKWVTGENWTYNNINKYGTSDGYRYYMYITEEGWSYAGYGHSSSYIPETKYYICEWDTSRDTVLPDQVKSLKVKKVTSTSVVVSWKKVSGAKGYSIYMKQGSKGTYKKIKTITKGGTTAFYKTKLKKGKTYYFRVRAYKNIYGERSYGELSAQKKIKLK